MLAIFVSRDISGKYYEGIKVKDICELEETLIKSIYEI